tara:strand:+ start:1182 stop:2009 length:828 start_codon:yes stop_codon:yes gene_type:complete
VSLSLGVIGAGRIAQTLINPLIEKGDFLPGNILGVVGNEGSIPLALDQFPEGVRIVSANNADADEVWSAPVKLLAIKPQQLIDIEEKKGIPESAGPLRKPLLISVLAGVNLKRLQRVFPGHTCVRAVPNMPVVVRAGLTGLSWGDDCTNDLRLVVKRFFNPISEVFELPEEQLDAFLALTSSGPAYIALIAEALADGAVAAGLPRLLASHLANRTLEGTALLLKEKDLHPGELKDMVASPAGTTIAALRHLEMASVRSALIEAVVAAAERSRELA